MSMKFLGGRLVQSFLIVLVSGIAALCVNALRPNSLPLFSDWDAIVEERAQAQKPTEILIIPIEVMEQEYQKENVLVVDARAYDFFQMEHVPGARSLPLEEADAKLAELLAKVDPETKIITYCSGFSCAAAMDLAKKIVGHGRKKVAVFLGGMEEWQSLGLPVESDDGV